MLDDTSLKIIKILQKKARIPNVEVARQVGLAPSAVLERIRKLEKQGFIDGYEVCLNPERFQRSLVAFITVKTDRLCNTNDTGLELARIPEIQEVHYIAGDDAYLLKARVADTKALNCLVNEKIAGVNNILSTKTGIVLATFKETARIPLAEPKK